MKDRELIFFPIFGVIGAGIAVGIFAAIAAAAGSLDRIQDVISDSETKESLATGDIVQNPHANACMNRDVRTI